MKKFFYLFTIALLGLVTGCETEEPPFFDIEGGGDVVLQFANNDSTKQTVVFSTSCGWIAEPKEGWIKVSPTSGNAGSNQAIQIGVDRNETYGTRRGSVAITPNDINLLPITISVEQLQNNALILSTPTVTLPQSGGSFSVQLKANIDYEYEIKADWIKSVQTRALTDHTLRFEAEENPSLDQRVGEIVIKGGGFTETVTVTQAQTNHISLSTTEFSIESKGGSFLVDVEHNVDYTVKISADWVSQVQTRAVETETLNFAVAENTTYDDRTATITISGGGITETITVTQKQLNAINLST
ncbi:MAG: BACON domain-containing protein, partial [Clostridia bacterium]|nr:BACON domain-containing protein [Clostridia bacterium]